MGREGDSSPEVQERSAVASVTGGLRAQSWKHRHCLEGFLGQHDVASTSAPRAVQRLSVCAHADTPVQP